MIDLETEKKRLVELKAEYERMHGIFGDQKILGRIEEAKRWIALLENKPMSGEPNGC